MQENGCPDANGFGEGHTVVAFRALRRGFDIPGSDPPLPTHEAVVTPAYDAQMRDYSIREATAADLDGARVVMLDTVYRDFGTGYVPRWHADIIDPERFYLAPPRHTPLVAVDERDGTVAATAALDARGPAHPPNPLAGGALPVG